MSIIFEMASGIIEPSVKHDNVSRLATIPKHDQNELALRLLTVAESEEQQPIPRPRPWFTK